VTGRERQQTCIGGWVAVRTGDVGDIRQTRRGDLDAVATAHFVGGRVHHEQTHLSDGRLYLGHDFGVALAVHAPPVHLHDAVIQQESGSLCRRAFVHLADVLARAAAVGVQVKAVAGKVRPDSQVAEPRLQLVAARYSTWLI